MNTFLLLSDHKSQIPHVKTLKYCVPENMVSLKWSFHQIDSSLSLETADKTFSSYMPSVQILQKPRKNKALVSAKCTHGIKFWGLRGLCFQDTPLVTKVKLESCAVLAIFWDPFSLQFADFPFLSIWFSVFIKNTWEFFEFGIWCGFSVFPAAI